MDTAEKVREFLMANLNALGGGSSVGDDENFFELGFVDSMFAMQLICFVETEFKIKVTDEDLDLENFNTINRIVGFIERKK